MLVLVGLRQQEQGHQYGAVSVKLQKPNQGSEKKRFICKIGPFFERVPAYGATFSAFLNQIGLYCCAGVQAAHQKGASALSRIRRKAGCCF
ncbi:hypothetical protein ALQ03_101434 [Pseudomonas savastanoi pv. glycinea]|uniref:Uncharacterized protein n=1 Tax=Pseudomonas savastanoi pv. glycinea TaxID=318 RepID=A0A0P9R5W5_PSESG|nr:hypothetical protein ALO37_101303 [Pseudomonas savastanoi pv. glycinea]RMM68923.1 hypothetical protein ALQ75_101721 [Pseudomonas savastanoi pv. glycinea]RMM98701.1 hypothetical protein ALQ68_101736 [Pseudomonas savastanoi pv. glycinea]RMM99763.1 hypothetical protein ALQ69_101890 [Pseudomonas savastanoi pv. glycinea]RMP49807.1 hypothetical protein ALQ21_101267 [Pseudomonas savastanoi pv. glycinea]